MKHYHFIGIGGIGMSALAHILLDKSVKVSGSDLSYSTIVAALEKKGAQIIAESDPLPSTTTHVVYNSMVSSNHPMVKAAESLGIPLIHRSELLKDLMRGYKGLLVSGTHGKTTTTSLLTHVLVNTGCEISFAVGGIVKSLGVNGGYGKGEYFVAEADESDGSFNRLDPWGGIVTNIDNDHLDYWKTTEALIEGFRKFLIAHTSTDHLFWCIDDENLRSINPIGISYGFSEDAALKVLNFRQEGWYNEFDLHFASKQYENIKIPLIGGHNVLNTASVFGLCLRLGLQEEAIREAFLSFQGVERRAEKKGEYEGICFYDDYAHHPTEIIATLKAIKKACGNRRLVVAFQPHRYTRTRDCMEDFKEVFSPADVLVLTEIYAAGENEIEGINGQNLARKIEPSYSGMLHFCPRENLANFVSNMMLPNDVVVTMGAGDITKLSKEILNQIPG